MSDEPAEIPAGQPIEKAGHGPTRTGAEQQWDPEDLAEAEGMDPTPENVRGAAKQLAEEGRAAVERTVP